MSCLRAIVALGVTLLLPVVNSYPGEGRLGRTGALGESGSTSRRPQSPCRVAIVAPREARVLYGDTELRAAADCPEGGEISKVVLLVDGQVIAEMTRSPYRVIWNAGGSYRERLLEARLVDRQGRLAAAALRTPGAAFGDAVRVTSTPLDLVELSVSVTDADRQHVRDLTLEDFVVEEDGKEQCLEAVEPEKRPLSIAILIDVSSSVNRWWPTLREATPALARTLRPQDAAKVVAFTGPAYMVQDFTRDPLRIADSMADFRHWGGGTSLYDTLAAVGTELAWGRGGRKAIVLLTDGLDTLSRIDPKRLRNYMRRTDVSVETFLIYTEASRANIDAARARKALQTLSRETGGMMRRLALRDIEGIEREFRNLGENLQNRYYLSYHSDKAGREGGWRTIKVRVNRPGLTVWTRRGIIDHRDIGAALVEDLRDGTVAERRKAAEWLGSMRIPGAAEPLLEALSDRSSQVRSAAAVALGNIHEPRAVEPLVELLFDGDVSVREGAAEGLMTIGPIAVPAIVAALEDARSRADRIGRFEEGQIKALTVLAEIGDARAVEIIAGLAQPPRPSTALPDGGYQESTPRSQRADARVRAWAIWALGKMARPETLPILETAAKAKETEIRLVAVWALGDTGLPQAIPILLRTVKEDEPDPELRGARREVLERLRSAATGTSEPE